jgi:hypothetical protein
MMGLDASGAFRLWTELNYSLQLATQLYEEDSILRNISFNKKKKLKLRKGRKRKERAGVSYVYWKGM